MKSDIIYNLDNKKWILTDFFDTLVHRTVHEDTIREIWAKAVSEKLCCSVSAKQIWTVRKDSTKKLVRSYKTEELRYAEIVKEMYVYLHSKVNMPLEDFIALCVKEELNVEKEHLYLDETMVSFLRNKKREGLKVAIVSDFYLSKKNMEFLIENLGISDIPDELFVSSEYGVKKWSGNLYKVVINTLGPSAEMVMFGDNENADCLAARKQGIDSYHLEWIQPSKNKDIEKTLDKLFREEKGHPFSNYAFIYYLYIDRIYNRLIKLQPKKVFFLAREGYFLIKLFEAYQVNKDQKFVADYLYVSRKATLLASVDGASETEFGSIFKSYKDLDVESFLKNLSFSDLEIEEVVSNVSFDCSKVLYGLKDTSEFDELLSNSNFKRIIDRKCEVERNLFEKYIAQFGISEDDEIILIDVGWKGTIQDNIYRALGERYKIRGLYLGYENCTGYETWRNIKEGLIFSKYPTHSKNYALWDFETHLIEQMLAAPHASTRGYSEENGKVKPVLEEYTIEDKELYSIAEPVQYGIMKIFRDICSAFEKSYYVADDLEYFFTRHHLRTLLLLNKKCIEFEKIALTPKTNNFGWFKKIPTRSSKKEKYRSMLKDLKHIKDSNLGFMSYVSYYAIKLNARHKYNWKIYGYRLVYVVEKFLIRK